MKRTKLLIKICLIVESIAFVYFLFLKDANCHGDCFDGLNTAIIFVLPLLIVTLLMWIGLIVNGRMHK
jgi:hypothetical protein